MPATRTFSGQHLRQRRKARGINRELLALAISRTVATVGNYERGRSCPPADVLAEIAQTLDCEIGDLFEEDGDAA